MDQIECTTTERDALHSWRFHHPHPRVQRKMAALDLQSPGLAPEDICRLCCISKATFYRSLHMDHEGGIDTRTEVPFYRRQSQLAEYRPSIAADFRQRPPASVAAAAARMADLTGLERGPTQGRQCLKSWGMHPPCVSPHPSVTSPVALYFLGTRSPTSEEVSPCQHAAED